MVEKNNRDLQINIKSMESRLFQALKAFKGAEGCEANLFEEFKKIAEAAFFSGHFLINGGCKDEYKLKNDSKELDRLYYGF